jgi:hypothetical protein
MPVEATDPLTGIRVWVGEAEDGERIIRCLHCRETLFTWPAIGTVNELDELIDRTKNACATHWIRSRVCGVAELEF